MKKQQTKAPSMRQEGDPGVPSLWGTPGVVEELLFSDLIALTGILSPIVDSYRLLVGAAEELTRTPGVSQSAKSEAIARAVSLGKVIDLTIFTLAAKVIIVYQTLLVTPVSLPFILAVIGKASGAQSSPAPKPPEQSPGPKAPWPLPPIYWQTIGESEEELETEVEEDLEYEADQELEFEVNEESMPQSEAD